MVDPFLTLFPEWTSCVEGLIMVDFRFLWFERARGPNPTRNFPQCSAALPLSSCYPARGVHFKVDRVLVTTLSQQIHHDLGVLNLFHPRVLSEKWCLWGWCDKVNWCHDLLSGQSRCSGKPPPRLTRGLTLYKDFGLFQLQRRSWKKGKLWEPMTCFGWYVGACR